MPKQVFWGSFHLLLSISNPLPSRACAFHSFHFDRRYFLFFFSLRELSREEKKQIKHQKHSMVFFFLRS